MKTKSYKSNHALEILTKLNNERKSHKDFCDVSLNADAKTLSSHKCILGMFSTFFLKMFTSDMIERYANTANLQGVDSETLESVLDYICTGDVTITSSNVYNLIQASNYMEIPHLKQFCVDFLLDTVDASNCLSIKAYSKLYDLEDLGKKANLVVVDQFEAVINEDEFYKLKVEDVVDILRMEKKPTLSEEIVFHAIICWIKHDVGEREQHLHKLFRLIKLEKLSLNFYRSFVRQEGLIINCNKCLQLCFQSILSREISENNFAGIVDDHKNMENNILVFSRKQVRKYVVDKKEIHYLQNMRHNHHFGSAVQNSRKVFVISGSSTEAMEVLDLGTQASNWTQLASINTQRYGGASCVFNDRIYNYGGHSAGEDLQSGQVYDILENKWDILSPMNQGRYFFGLAKAQNALYAFGGYRTHTVEHFDPRQGSWIISSSLNINRYAFSTAALNDLIYVIGGSNKSDNLTKSVEVFDPVNQSWRNVAELNHARGYHGACVVEGKIYVAGGRPEVEVYDPVKDVWEIESNLKFFQNVQFTVPI